MPCPRSSATEPRKRDDVSATRAICKTGEVPPGSVKRVGVEGLPPLAVYNLEGTFYVTDDTCTHGQASLSEGYIEGKEIECPWHGGRFEIATGRATCYPVVEDVQTYTVTIVGDDVCITA
jgi:nitrite reductase/ring-hydroxylating ferredoxin subunit